jgi:T5SS/PEP-CTERM-associated repeat protein
VVVAWQWDGSGDFNTATNWFTVNAGGTLINGVPGSSDQAYIGFGQLSGSGSVDRFWVIGAVTFSSASVSTQTEFFIGAGNSLTLTSDSTAAGPTSEGAGAAFENFGLLDIESTSQVTSYSVQSFETLLVESGTVSSTNFEQGGYNDPINGYVPGSLDIASAGSITDTTGIVGLTATDDVTVTMAGGANWTNQGIGIGSAGNVTVTVSSGATISTGGGGAFPGGPALLIGGRASGDGTSVTVTGANSEIKDSSDAWIGGYSAAAVSLTAGGILDIGGSLDAVVRAGGSDNILIDTGGSFMQVGGNATLGDAGALTATINNGGSLTIGGSLLAGNQTAGSASFDVDGGLLGVTGDATLGVSGAGNLTLTSGGTLNIGGTLVEGSSSGARGTTVIDDPGDKVTLASDLVVGSGGAHSDTISGGASFDIGTALIVGQSSGGAGTLTITGSSTKIGVGSDITIAAGGQGTLSLDQGVSLDAFSGGLVVGGTAGATGTVSVSGNGTALRLGHDATIGAAGTASMSVADNASFDVSGGALMLGASNGGSGTLSLSGDGIDVAPGKDTTVGGGGGGSIDIEAGATLDDQAGTLTLGRDGGSSGQVTITGTNALGESEELVVGGGGSGTLSLSSEGSLSTMSDVTAGATHGGTGMISVGTSAELSVGGALTIGDAGSASLDVNGGSLDITGQTLTAGASGGGNGDVSLENTTLSFASGNIVVGAAGTGSFSANTKATANANDLDIGQSLTGNGTVVFAGASGYFSNVNAGIAGVAAVDVTAKGTVTATNLFIATQAVPIAAAVTVDSGGVVQAALEVAVGQGGDAALDIESGGKVQATSVFAGEGDGVNATVTLNSSTSSKSSLIYGSLFEIGDLGTADVTITGSAGATPDALDPGLVEIGLSAGSSGTLSISGSSAKLTAGTTEIGGGATAGGAGIVTLDSSAVLSSGTTTIWSGGSLVLTGGSLSGTTESFMGAASGYGSITGTIANTGTITATDGVLSLGSLVLGAGTLALSAGTLDLKKGAAATQIIQFESGTDKLQLDTFAATKGTIEGFGTSDSIVLTGTLADHGTWAGGVLTLTETADAVGTLSVAGAFSADSFKVTNNGTNTTIVLACFATGTGIATVAGRRPVEALAVGDLVPTASGRLARITWIGYRETDLVRHARPWDVMPVRVRAGALGEGVPLRDLVLSPDHAVLMDGALIPIRHLVNGASIVQETRRRITYWHVELDRHNALLAEGAPCESYLDTGNRHAFAGSAAIELHPDFAQHQAMAVWNARGCAPILTDPADPRLRATHLRLLARGREARQNSESQSVLLR